MAGAQEVLGVRKIGAIIRPGCYRLRTGRASDARFEAWGDVVPACIDLARRHAL